MHFLNPKSLSAGGESKTFSGKHNLTWSKIVTGANIDGVSTFKLGSLFLFAADSVRSDEFDSLFDLTSCSIILDALLTTLDAVTLVRILFILSHPLWKTSLQSPLSIWGIRYVLVSSSALAIAVSSSIPKEYDSQRQGQFKMVVSCLLR